jgi:carbonic anhydrase
MSSTDESLKANAQFARDFELGSLPKQPAKKLAIVACMDARLTVEQILGLQTGDAHIIRNAGGIVSDDALRSLIISNHLLGTKEILVINHTDCGMLTFKDQDLRDKLIAATGVDATAPAHFHTFSDLAENVRQQVKRVKSHPWIPKEISVRGLIYDVTTGQLNPVAEELEKEQVG